MNGWMSTRTSETPHSQHGAVFVSKARSIPSFVPLRSPGERRRVPSHRARTLLWPPTLEISPLPLHPPVHVPTPKLAFLMGRSCSVGVQNQGLGISAALCPPRCSHSPEKGPEEAKGLPGSSSCSRPLAGPASQGVPAPGSR